MTSVVNNYIKAIAPEFNGDAIVRDHDKRTRFRERRTLRTEMAQHLGPTWNTRQYDAAAMRAISEDTRFSEGARRAALYLSSSDGEQVLRRMNARSGSRNDRRFSIKDLEAENSAAVTERASIAKDKHAIAAELLGQTTKKLSDTFNKAVVSTISLQSQVLRPPSTRID